MRPTSFIRDRDCTHEWNPSTTLIIKGVYVDNVRKRARSHEMAGTVKSVTCYKNAVCIIPVLIYHIYIYGAAGCTYIAPQYSALTTPRDMWSRGTIWKKWEEMRVMIHWQPLFHPLHALNAEVKHDIICSPGKNHLVRFTQQSGLAITVSGWDLFPKTMASNQISLHQESAMPFE